MRAGLAVLGRLLFFGLALALQGCPLLQGLATLLRTGAARIRRTGLGLRTRRIFLRAGCPGHGGGWNIGATALLPLFNAVQSLRGPLPALSVVHHGLLLTQHRQVLSRTAARGPQAVFHCKPLIAGGLGALERFIDGEALTADPFALRSMIQRHLVL